MAKVLFKRKTTAEIEDLEVEDGALIYNTDNGKTYMDFGEERIQTGGNADTMIAIGGEEPTDTDIKLWFPDDIANLKYDKMYIRNPITNKWEEVFLPPTGDTYPIGMYGWFAGENAPTNWLRCDGQEISRTEYKELFNAIGTTYGVGDGSTTFNLPNVNLENRTLVGSSGDGEFSVGNTGGEKEHKLIVSEMPAHGHKLPNDGAFSLSSDGSSAAGITFGKKVGNSSLLSTNSGGNQPHNNMQPYMASVCCIKAKQSVGLVGNVVSDMNAQGDNDVAPTKVIKEYVDKKQTYSTDEIVVGTWLGKPLYRKVIDFGDLPNITYKDVSINIYDEIDVMRIYGTGISSNGNKLPIPYAGGGSYDIAISYQHTTKSVRIQTYSDRSSMSAQVVIEYTKTTDEVTE